MAKLERTISDNSQEQITLERVLADDLCSPVTLKDFRVYLTHMEYSVENLGEFERFQLRLSILVTSTTVHLHCCFPNNPYQPNSHEPRNHLYLHYIQTLSPPPQRKYRGLVISESSSDSGLEFPNPSPLPSPRASSTVSMSNTTTSDAQTLVKTYGYEIEMVPVVSKSGPEILPSQQSFRAEIDIILATYLLPGAPKELNLDGKLRAYVIENAKNSTHPTIFEAAAHAVYVTMNDASFPNFKRMTVTNVGRPGIIEITCLYIGWMLLGVGVVLIPLCLNKSRWWRLFGILFFWSGFANVAACY
ncbi:hypothetical protein BC938DRAFT_480654, partial [Jimgerdemannia flammicorona]